MDKLTLSLPAMYGDHHVTEVRNALIALAGVHHVYASAACQQVEIEFDASRLQAEDIRRALSERGYAEDGAALPLTSPRTKQLTDYAVGPGGVEQFVERVPAWGAPAGACPGFEVLHPGDVHPADRT